MHHGARPRLFLLAVTTAMLLPFLGKAFHVDDPLYLWTARQIQSQPLDFYGFVITWDQRTRPMHEEMQNPPLFAYYLAAVAACFGWNEVGIHLSLLPVSLLAAWGTYELSSRFCARPLLASLAAVLTPVFVVSATQVMGDMMFLALWVWSLHGWDIGIREEKRGPLLLACVLAGAATYAKYFGIALVPLLVLHALLYGRWRVIAYLLIPLALIVAFEAWTTRHYGHGLLGSAFVNADSRRNPYSTFLATEFLATLTFVGGCFASAWLIAGCCRPQRFLAAFLFAAALLMALLPLLATVIPGFESHVERMDILVQISVFAAVGGSCIWLWFRDLTRQRDRTSLLLFAWLAGTLSFTALVNWTISARNLLPMVPAMGIVLARHVDWIQARTKIRMDKRVVVGLVASGLLAFWVAAADWRLAESGREAAKELLAECLDSKGNVWFTGDWGFQYYMQLGGAKPLDLAEWRMAKGACFIGALSATQVLELPPIVARRRRLLDYPVGFGLATMSEFRAAGFYSTLSGPLPFGFGSVPPRRFVLQEILHDIGAKRHPEDGAQP